MIGLVKFYVILSLWRLLNQCPKRVLLIFRKRYPYVSVGPLEPIHIKDTFTKNNYLLQEVSVLQYEKTHKAYLRLHLLVYGFV